MKYWLGKSEPDCYSIDKLASEKDQTTPWDGVRNYQARNFMRDEMKKGDKFIFYHSNTKPPAAVGICEVTKEAYPDFTAFDPENEHFDPKSKDDNPRWFMVDVKLIEKFEKSVSLAEMKENPKLKDMKLIQKGNRLSVMPITKKEYEEIVKMSKK